MKNFILFFVLMTLMVNGKPAFALEWQKAHQKAALLNSQDVVRLISEKSDDIELYYLLGLTYLKEYNTSAARVAFEKMVEMDSVSIEGQWGMAEVFRREHNVQQSEKLLKMILLQTKDFAPAYVTAAYIEFLGLNFKEAARLANQVVRMGKEKSDRDNLVCALGLYAGAKGMLAHYGGPVAKLMSGTVVLSTLKKGEKIRPDSAVILMGLGSYYLLSPVLLGRDLDKAQKYLTLAINRDPFLVDAYVRLAQVFLLKNDKVQYNEYLQKGFNLDSQNELALDIRDRRCKFICVK